MYIRTRKKPQKTISRALFFYFYSAEIAPIGHIEVQVMQLKHLDVSISHFPAEFTEIAKAGQLILQAWHPTHKL